jgi:hypothetical protein
MNLQRFSPLLFLLITLSSCSIVEYSTYDNYEEESYSKGELVLDILFAFFG